MNSRKTVSVVENYAGKFVTFSVNDVANFKLTDKGKKVFYDHLVENGSIKDTTNFTPENVSNVIKLSFWEAMKIFGCFYNEDGDDILISMVELVVADYATTSGAADNAETGAAQEEAIADIIEEN